MISTSTAQKLKDVGFSQSCRPGEESAMAAVIGQPGTTERVRLPRFEYLIEALAEHNRPIFRIERGFHPEHGKEWFRAETLKGDVAEGNSIEEAVGALLLHVLYAES